MTAINRVSDLDAEADVLDAIVFGCWPPFDGEILPLPKRTRARPKILFTLRALSDRDFTRPMARETFRIIRRACAERTELSWSQIAAELKRSWTGESVARWVSFAAGAGVASAIPSYVARLKRCTARREALRVLADASADLIAGAHPSDVLAGVGSVTSER